jgi:transcriptional regulator with XRE-family HTH domain
VSKLSEYLNGIANKRGLDSTRKFADAAGISKTTAAELLAGRPPRAETLEKVADGLGLPLARMRELAGIGVAGEPFVLPAELYALDARQRRLLISVGRMFLAIREDEEPMSESQDDQVPTPQFSDGA